MDDEIYMAKALELAQKGAGYVSPNPMVGAVIVKDNKIIGQGYHRRYGDFHGERDALGRCEVSPKGGTIYVNLEPCCHYGKQPPCVKAIVDAGITRVVVGIRDPNPLVAGKGIAYLRQHGIDVVEGVLAEQCRQLNAVFFHYIQNNQPYVVMKYAMTLDGKIATVAGQSQWITGETARTHVHMQRHKYTGIMVGIGTVLADDPLLTCRLPEGKNPLRIICDTHLRIPFTCRILKTAREVPTILATCCTDKQKQAIYQNQGCQIIETPVLEGHVDLPFLMKQLGQNGIDSVLLEGGAALNWSAIKYGLIHKVQVYVGAKLFGGMQAKSSIGGVGFPYLTETPCLRNMQIMSLSKDFLIEGEVMSNVHRNH